MTLTTRRTRVSICQPHGGAGASDWSRVGTWVRWGRINDAVDELLNLQAGMPSCARLAQRCRVARDITDARRHEAEPGMAEQIRCAASGR
jgi:hypothetical protein